MTITCIEDLRVLHQRRVPKMFYDYAESGSWTERTFRRNEEAFTEIRLRQRVAKDISQRSVAGNMLDESQYIGCRLRTQYRSWIDNMEHWQDTDGPVRTASSRPAHRQSEADAQHMRRNQRTRVE